MNLRPRLLMASDFSTKLAAALGGTLHSPGPIQRLYDEFKRHLHLREVRTPLPETVTLLPENFPYWIKLENRDPTRPSEWIPSKANVVIPLLEARTFDEACYRFDPSRGKALCHIPHLLQTPNCVHRNLRSRASRGQGGIRGDHIYVAYYGKKRRKVAFTILDPNIDRVILVTSFWTFKKWVAECVGMPAVHVGEGCVCTCK
jgi:hypothetical protein